MRAASLSPNLAKLSPGIARRKLAARLTRAMSRSANGARMRLKMARGAFSLSSTTVLPTVPISATMPNCDKRGQPAHELTDDMNEKEDGAREGKDDRLALLPIQLLGHLDERFQVLHRICDHEDGE
ncbi:uncharacterized protein NFIA_028070 [Aspergillus fischeri NRRL 181]|uniref:Uncharacterized protein n=1 Tax=Neosartorya fischeri (strain ATCC 1020 / DSM 3700 / CBS 544.65 / FGSC A1164 / JCM 1740 / NRRL 181 / WB 181) TaxID=331117 RepID=A1DD23_NEOFI|nr:uncharacterized protein NFIA_028070 [Aspergillus fischeri NRRL 181]EAW19733.1 hypothetical protein NFIA_028070 [Aspergillus fischeri NRRL 181]